MTTKEELGSLRVLQINTLDISPDGQYCYGYKTPNNEEVINKVNELIDKFNDLLEVLSNDK